MKKFVCTVCGYVYEGEELPENYECPLCGVGPESFEEEEYSPFTINKILSNIFGGNNYEEICMFCLWLCSHCR